MADAPPLETFKKTNLPGVFTIERPSFPDDRGSFQEVVRFPELEQAIGQQIFIRQINKSVSKPKVLRGIHVAPWGKLVHCYQGEVYQVVVDCRDQSPTFGEVFTCQMGDSHPITIWIPPGCGNGLCVLGQEKAVYGYSVTATYELGKELGLRWNDPKISSKIHWPVKEPIISEKDAKNSSFEELFPNGKGFSL